MSSLGASFQLFLPEGIITLSALWILLEGVFQRASHGEYAFRFGQKALLALVFTLLGMTFIHYFQVEESHLAFQGQMVTNDYIYMAKILILLAGGGVLAISLPHLRKGTFVSFEYASLILLSLLGMLIMVGANDFLALFIGLEIQALSLYILAALNRGEILSSEAALKYFILGALASCLYLYGASLLYGFAGSTNFDALAMVIQQESASGLPLGLLIGLTFIIGAMAFKVSAVPFHMWTPDVYEGCPTFITAFIAAAPKLAGMFVFLRLLVSPFLLLYGDWQIIIMGISIASMVVGAFAALLQTDIKRLLAYSTIGQMGYVLLAVAGGNGEGIQAVFVYLTIYVVVIIGIFGCLLCLRGEGQEEVKNIEDFSGLSTVHPKTAFALAAFMFSLAGIPPLAGFFGKFYIFKAAIAAGLFGLAIIGVLTAVVAAYYYLKIVKVMYFDPVPENPSKTYGRSLDSSLPGAIVITFALGFILFFFLYPNPVIEMAERAAAAIPL